MSVSEIEIVAEGSPETKKRKREVNEEELEIDLDAPEPPSKKALRKAKRGKISNVQKVDEQIRQPKDKVIGSEDVVPNRGKRSEYGVWIGNLLFTTTKQDLLDFMTGDSDHKIAQEQITRINLPAGPAKFGKFQNKGFAYIDLADKNSLQSAVQLSEKLLAGRRVLIKDAKSFEGRPKEAVKESPGNPPSKRIFVGNLDFTTTVEDLESHFEVCGPIQHTQMATFEDSGKCKGYAWIEFEQLSSGQAAMRGWVEEGTQSDGTGAKNSKRRIWVGKMKGRKLRMEFAEDKTTRYNKRFGKKATSEVVDGAAPIEEISRAATDDKATTELNLDNQQHSVTRANQRTGGKGRTQRYTHETVQKLTGAIVEGQGQKVTFD